MADTLALRVYVSPYKPIPAAVPGWDPGRQATWPATTSTLIAGATEAILVDALMTSAEAKALDEWVRAAGKDVTSLYVTHGHADHFFGAADVLQSYPDARFVTFPGALPMALDQVRDGFLKVWNGFFPGQIVDHPVVPVALDGDELILEGKAMRVLAVGQSDVEQSSIVHIPEIDAVISGDVAYNGIHMWLSGSDHDKRLAWIEALDSIERLAPTTIVAGHKDPAAPDDHATRILDESRQYIRDFDEVVAASDSTAEIIDKMLAKHPNRGNPYTLWVAAQGQVA